MRYFYPGFDYYPMDKEFKKGLTYGLFLGLVSAALFFIAAYLSSICYAL